MESKKIHILIEASILLGLSVVFSCFAIFTLPQGGDISIAVLPILIFSYKRGTKNGILLSIGHGFLQFALKPFVINPLSFFLDYILSNIVLSFISHKKLWCSFFMSYVFRYFTYVLSGVLVWATLYSNTDNFLVYSMVYNAIYIGPEMILNFIILYFLKVKKYI